jgi:acyl-CoA thioesterase-1
VSACIRKILLALLCCLFTLPALAEKTILIVGDSLSAAYGIDIQQGWVNLLKERLEEEHYEYRVINASISGDTTSNGLARLPAALKQYQPAITIIELGANDGLRGLQISVIKNNILRMIALAQEAESKVLVLGMRLPPNYGPAYTQQFHQLFTDLANQDDIHLVPIFLQGIEDNKSLFQADNLHPTAEAQGIMLDNVWVVLKGML